VLTIRRPSSEQDFNQLYELINFFAAKFEMLPKTLDELYHSAQAFRVIVIDDKVIGSAHLDLFTPTLAEVKSLAVDAKHQGQGIGRLLVEDCEKEAKDLGIKNIFALTYKEKFFEKIGYKQVSMDALPEKVYKECVKCRYYNNCNEIAVLKIL